MEAETKTVYFLFRDVWLTTFMQDADVFEKFKVLVKPPVRAEVRKDWGKKEVELVYKHDDRYILVAAVGTDGDVYYTDPTVKAISNGMKWCTLDDFLGNVVEGVRLFGDRS